MLNYTQLRAFHATGEVLRKILRGAFSGDTVLVMIAIMRATMLPLEKTENQARIRALLKKAAYTVN